MTQLIALSPQTSTTESSCVYHAFKPDDVTWSGRRSQLAKSTPSPFHYSRGFHFPVLLDRQPLADRVTSIPWSTKSLTRLLDNIDGKTRTTRAMTQNSDVSPGKPQHCQQEPKPESPKETVRPAFGPSKELSETANESIVVSAEPQQASSENILPEEGQIESKEGLGSSTMASIEGGGSCTVREYPILIKVFPTLKHLR